MQGYKVIGGVLEAEDNYYKRISGIVRLYAAIIQYPVPKEIVSSSDNAVILNDVIFSQPHPFGPEHGWEWLANILNSDPRGGITATALLHFLEVCDLLMHAYTDTGIQTRAYRQTHAQTHTFILLT